MSEMGTSSGVSDFGEHLLVIQNLRSQNSNLNFEILSCHQGEWEAKRVRAFLKNAAEIVHSPEEFSSLWPSPYRVHTFRHSIPTAI